MGPCWADEPHRGASTRSAWNPYARSEETKRSMGHHRFAEHRHRAHSAKVSVLAPNYRFKGHHATGAHLNLVLSVHFREI